MTGINKLVIILIRPPDPLQDSSLLSHTRPMNLAYLAAKLRMEGFEPFIIDYETTPFDPVKLLQHIGQLRPLAVGFSSATPTITAAAAIATTIKQQYPELATIIGGPHGSALPKQTMEEFPCFDYLVYGEGELTLTELCHTLQDGGSLSAINGLCFRNEGGVVISPPRALIDPLDQLPFPARDLIDFSPQAGHSSRGFSNKTLSTELFTSRGCPVGCSFCAIQATFGRTVRFRELDALRDEIDELQKLLPFNHLVIADDTFTLKADRAAALCDVIAASRIASWNCDTRVNTVSLELLKMMRQSGCEKVAFGVESGSRRVLDAIGKKITPEQVAQAVQWAQKAGIKHIEGNFIIGCDPTETVEELEETKKLIIRLPWTFVSVAVIVPYPGTPVRQSMLVKDLIDPDACWDDYVMFGKPPKWRTDHFSAETLLEQQRKLTRAFYLRPSYITKRLIAIRTTEELSYWLTAGVSYLKWYLTGRG